MRQGSRHAHRSGSAPRPAAISSEILINASAGETRVALLEQGSFSELHIEREGERSVTGAVALGRVTRVLPGMQAAFVDIGLEKAAFLYVGDYLDDSGQLDPEAADDDDEAPRPRRQRGRNGNGRPPPKIDTLLREGQEIVVQVAKEPIGTKGARITSHVSIAGRHLVLTPWSQRVGVSRRIDSDRERRRLRDVVSRVRPPDLGFIIRTAGEGARDADLEADVKYLTSVWDEIQIRKDEVSAPALLYSELSLPLRVIRDMANSKTRRIVVDDPKIYDEMKDFLSRFVAEPKPRLEHYQGPLPIFDHFGIESRIDDNLGKKVWLKSGGYLIDRPERGAHRDRRQHRALRRQARPRGDRPQDEPRGREGGRLPAPLPQHRRADHHRPDRHGERGEPREGLSRAPGGAASGQGEDEHPQDLRARPGRDDAQAHAREPRAAALRALQLLRRARLRALARERRLQGAARDPQGPAALLRAARSRSR